MSKFKKFVIAADNHGDQVDPETAAALFGFIADFKPALRIHAGDVWDLRNLRRGASDEDRADSLLNDWGMGNDFLRRFFDGGRENHLLRGNHDERPWQYLKNTNGFVRDAALIAIEAIENLVGKCRAQMLPYDARLGVLRIGELKVVHGYAVGINAARRHAITYRNCLFGHTHNTDVAGVETDHGIAEARGIGASCKIDMAWNSHMLAKLRHQNAFCYGLAFDNGTYQLNQAKKIDGKFHISSEFKTY